MADWRAAEIELPARASLADVSHQFSLSNNQTILTGQLSSDVDNRSLYNHTQFLARLDSLKALLHPRKGYRKLVITGDLPNRYRWARYRSMSDFTEQFPVFKLPFQGLSITFDNFEPYWRETSPPIAVSTVPTAVPNTGTDDSPPVIDVVIGSAIAALPGAAVQAAVLFTIDDLDVNWKGTSPSAQLNAGDVLTIDSENNTAILTPGGSGTPTDAVRYYDYGGPGAYAGNGFPTVRAGGSTVSAIHPNVSSLTLRYDNLYA